MEFEYQSKDVDNIIKEYIESKQYNLCMKAIRNMKILRYQYDRKYNPTWPAGFWDRVKYRYNPKEISYSLWDGFFLDKYN